MSNDNYKLRTYRLFKDTYCVENYLLCNMPGKYRSSLAKFICGTAPIMAETGRYENLSSENRACFNCSMNIEDEKGIRRYQRGRHKIVKSEDKQDQNQVIF